MEDRNNNLKEETKRLVTLNMELERKSDNLVAFDVLRQ
jgi:hypothetical protein